MASTVSETKENTILNWRNPPKKNTVVWHNDPFASGKFRDAYIGFQTIHSRNPGQKVVVKRLRDVTCWAEPNWDNDMKTWKKAKEFVEAWNAMKLLNKKLDMQDSFICKVVVAENKDAFPVGSFVIVEPFIDGNYEKWNSNSGWTERDSLSINAFCHWTYHFSDGKLLFCDAQGVRTESSYIITDPCIMSENAGDYGMADCGKEFMIAWMRKHKCNQFCLSSWRREGGKSVHAAQPRTMMAWEVNTGLNPKAPRGRPLSPESGDEDG